MEEGSCALLSSVDTRPKGVTSMNRPAESSDELPEIELSDVVEEGSAPPSVPVDALAIEIDAPGAAGAPDRLAREPSGTETASSGNDEEDVAIDLDLDLDLSAPPTAADATDIQNEVPVLPAIDRSEPEARGATPVVAEPSLPSLDMDELFGDLDEREEGSTPEETAAAPGDPLVSNDDEALEIPAPEVVSAPDPDAPSLPLSADEPEPRPAISARQLQPDENVLETLKQLAGPGGDPDRARANLQAAFRGGTYDPRYLPDGRVIAVGLGRALARSGFSVEQLVDAILEVLDE